MIVCQVQNNSVLGVMRFMMIFLLQILPIGPTADEVAYRSYSVVLL